MSIRLLRHKKTSTICKEGGKRGSKRIKGITIELSGDTTGLEKALEDVDKSIRDTSGKLRDVNRLLKFDPQNVTLLGQKHQYLKEQIDQTKNRLKALKDADKQAKAQLESGNLGKDQYEALQREIVETEQKLKSLKKESGSASAAMEGISATTGKIGAAAEKVGKKMLPVTGIVAGLGTASVSASNQFEDSMSQAAGALDLPMSQMEELRELALKTGQDTIFSAKEAGNAITELAKGGLTEADIKGGALKTTMDLAAASGMDLGNAANTVVQAMGAFGLSAEQSAEAANALAGAAAASSTDVEPLTQGLAQASAQANNAGWSIQETTAVLGRFADAGIVGSDAGTSLKTMLQRMAAPTDEAATMMESLGINTRDANGTLLGASEMAQELQTKLGGLSEAQRDAALQTIFGSDASRAASVMMRTGEEGLQKYIKATNDQEAAQRLANSQMGSGSKAMEELKGSLETAAISIGDAIAPAVQKIAEVITQIVNGFTELPEGIQMAIVAFTLLLGALGPVLIIIGKISTGISAVTNAFSMMSGIGGLIQTVLGSIGNAFKGLFGIISAHPVITVVTVIVGAIVLLYNKCEWFREGVHAVIDAIISFGKNMIEKIQSGFNTITEKISGFVSSISQWWNNLKTKTSEKWNEIKRLIVDTVSNIIQTGVSGFQNLVSGISEKVSNITSVVTKGFSGAVSYITSLPRKALQWGKDFIQGLIDGIKSMVGKVVSAVKGVANKITSFLHFSRPDEGPLRNYETWMPDFMDGLAKGIEQNRSKIQKAVEKVSGDLKLNVNTAIGAKTEAGGTTEVNFYGNYKFESQDDVDYFMNQAALRVARAR